MTELLLQVALYGLAAAAAAPIALVVCALILGMSGRPLAGAWTFTAGAAFLDVVFATVILASSMFDDAGDAGAYVDVGLGVLFAVIGAIAVLSHESPEKQRARQARAQQIATAGLKSLFLAGLAVQVINFDAIAVFGGALKEIAAADVSTSEEIVATAFGLAIMLSVYYAPTIIYVLVPQKSQAMLGAITTWVIAHSRILEIATGLGFGVLFLWKGLAVLL